HVKILVPNFDEAILGKEDEDHLKIVEEINPGIIALGYDQRYDIEELKSQLKKRGLDIDIFRIGAYKDNIYKSSKLK
ncbi:FAD synthase, partial [Nanoarchaeota archaeon]